MLLYHRKGYDILQKDILIFLDIDGVLNTSNSFNTKYELYEENIFALKTLTDRLSKHHYSSRIILTSTWRLGFDADFEKCSPQIKNLILKLGKVNIQIAGKTTVYKGKTRDVEILRYIREYQLKEKAFTYIILDDDETIFNKEALQEMNFYKINQHTGLVRNDIDWIVKMIVRGKQNG